MLDELEKGPWPSHVTELKKGKYPIEAYAQGLGQGLSPWFGGSARIRCEFTGFIARRTRDGKQTELHFRIYHPSGQFYRTDELRKLLDFCDKFGLGSVETVGQTGDLVMPIQPDLADQAVDELRALGTDIGGTGDTFRDSAACVGPALCEYALFDSLAARDYYFRTRRSTTSSRANRSRSRSRSSSARAPWIARGRPTERISLSWGSGKGLPTWTQPPFGRNPRPGRSPGLT